MTHQNAFFEALMTADMTPPDGLIGHSDGVSVGQRFNVYRNNVFHNLIEALQAAFPLIEKTLGAPGFQILAKDFIKAHLPSHPVLYRYGQALPDFLSDYAPLAHLGYLPDLARLELAISEVCDAPDHTPYPAQNLTGLTETDINELSLELAPSVRILGSPWPIYMLWAFLTDKGDAPDMKPQEVMVFRHEFSPIIRLLPPGGYAFLEAVKGGEPLGEAMTIAEASDAALSAETVQTIFNDVMQYALVKSVTMKGK